MRVVVFGASGWVGSALPARLGPETLAPPRRTADVTRRDSVTRFLERVRPDAVVNVAVAQSSATRARMLAVNATGAGNVATAAAAVGARLVHVSTDMVLDGSSAPYTDDAPAAPITAYGESKAAGEEAVRAAHPGAVIVRTSLVYDPAAADRPTQSFVRRLEAGLACPLYTDEIRCPITRGALCDALAELVRLDVAGGLNVAGTEALSRYDFALRLLRHFRAPGLDRVVPALAAELDEPRPLDLTLDVSRAAALLKTPLPGVGSLSA